MSWTTPITDRTILDVTQKTAKGYFNITDINRIESNCEYLADQLNSFGYKVAINVKTNWVEMDYLSLQQVDRIRSNINALIACYSKLQSSPDIRFVDTLDWQDVNSIEQNIQNIDTLLQRMVDGFRRCGGFIFYSGEGVILP